MQKILRTAVLAGILAFPLVSSAASEGRDTERDTEKEAKATRHLAAKIQKAVAKDVSLSSAARSVTVSVREGALTLQGSVKFDEESQAIQGKAESLVLQRDKDDFATAPEVRNELQVEPSK